MVLQPLNRITASIEENRTIVTFITAYMIKLTISGEKNDILSMTRKIEKGTRESKWTI